MTDNVELLEALRRRAGYLYISDLKQFGMNRKAWAFLYKIPVSQFSEQEWLDAAFYICGRYAANADAARELLLE